MDPTPEAFTRLLQDWRRGDRGALDALTPWVYDELRRVAENQMRGERPGHTLQATALVNEAFLRLAETEVPLADRAHFFALASTLMRRILVDHARKRRTHKRGGGAHKIGLDDVLPSLPSDLADEQPDDLLELDEALSELAKLDERKAKIIELHYFGGLSYLETAQAMGVSDVTVHRDLKLSRAWIKTRLTSGDA